MSYQSYWKEEVLRTMATLEGGFSLAGELGVTQPCHVIVTRFWIDVSDITGMTHEDVATTLLDLGYLQVVGGVTKLVLDPDELQERVATLRAPKHEIGRLALSSSADRV